MSPLITALAVIAAVALAVAPDLVAVNASFARYAMLIALGAAAAGKELKAEHARNGVAQLRSLRSGFPRRGMFSRKTLNLLLVAGLAGALLFTQACQPETVRGVSAGIAVGADVLRDEVAAGVSVGDYTQAEADFLNPVIDEVKRAAASIAARAEGWPEMSDGDRRALALEAVEKIGGAVERLSEASVGVKSARGRARLDKYLRRARLAIGTLRAIEAAMPRK